MFSLRSCVVTSFLETSAALNSKLSLFSIDPPDDSLMMKRINGLWKRNASAVEGSHIMQAHARHDRVFDWSTGLRKYYKK